MVQAVFRSLGRVSQHIQPESRYSDPRADLLPARFVGRERPPQKQIENPHAFMNSLGIPEAFLITGSLPLRALLSTDRTCYTHEQSNHSRGRRRTANPSCLASDAFQ